MNKQDYSKTDQLVIGTPIEQKFVNAGSANRSNGGVFEAQNLKKSSQSVAEFRELTMSERYKKWVSIDIPTKVKCLTRKNG